MPYASSRVRSGISFSSYDISMQLVILRQALCMCRSVLMFNQYENRRRNSCWYAEITGGPCQLRSDFSCRFYCRFRVSGATALSRSLAIIEFDQKGTILRANENFAMPWATAFGDQKVSITACLSIRIMFAVRTTRLSGQAQSRVSLTRGNTSALAKRAGGLDSGSYNPVINSKAPF